MDAGSRNARLCETLQGLGLYVIPIYSNLDPERIEYMHVSATIPVYAEAEPAKAAEATSRGAVASPVTGSDIGDTIQPAQDRGPNVVDFPTKLGQLSVLRPTDNSTVAIDSVSTAGNCSACIPGSAFAGFFEVDVSEQVS